MGKMEGGAACFCPRRYRFCPATSKTLVTGYFLHGAPDLAIWGTLVALFFTILFPILIRFDTTLSWNLVAVFFSLCISPHISHQGNIRDIDIRNRAELAGSGVARRGEPRLTSRECEQRDHSPYRRSVGDNCASVGVKPTRWLVDGAAVERERGEGFCEIACPHRIPEIPQYVLRSCLLLLPRPRWS